MPHSEALLLEIRKRAFFLYTQEGVPTPKNYERASVEFGIPNNQDALTEVRVEIRLLEAKIENNKPAPPKKQKRKKTQSEVTAPEPQPMDWQGHMIVRGHSIDLAKLNERDGRLAAANDKD